MSTYTNAQYVKNSLTGIVDSISVDIQGVPWTVPICPGNTDYDNIMVLVAEGQIVIQQAGIPS